MREKPKQWPFEASSPEQRGATIVPELPLLQNLRVGRISRTFHLASSPNRSTPCNFPARCLNFSNHGEFIIFERALFLRTQSCLHNLSPYWFFLPLFTQEIQFHLSLRTSCHCLKSSLLQVGRFQSLHLINSRSLFKTQSLILNTLFQTLMFLE